MIYIFCSWEYVIRSVHYRYLIFHRGYMLRIFMLYLFWILNLSGIARIYSIQWGFSTFIYFANCLFPSLSRTPKCNNTHRTYVLQVSGDFRLLYILQIGFFHLFPEFQSVLFHPEHVFYCAKLHPPPDFQFLLYKQLRQVL